MLQRTYLTILCKTYLFCLKITGFWPFDYDTQSRRFKFNPVYLILLLCVLVPYIFTVYAFNASLLLNAVKVLFKNIILKMVSNVYVSSNLLSLIFLYITQTSQNRKIKRLICRIINLYENLSEWLSLDDMNYLPNLIKFSIKSLLFAATAAMYMIVSMTAIAPNSIKFYSLPGFVVPVIVNKFYPDIFYGGMLLVDFYLLQINKELKRILNLRGKLACNDEELVDIIDRMDTISINYIELIEIVKAFNNIVSFRVVLWILLGVLNFIIHLFMQYVFIGVPIRYGHSLNTIISASGAINLIYQFLEFWLTSAICTSVMKRLEETETILSSTYVRLGEAGPFERSVNYFIIFCRLKNDFWGIHFVPFTLQIDIFLSRIKHQDLQITGCGLFPLESSLVYSVILFS